eukprot:1486222-Amphidinium_carterae.1
MVKKRRASARTRANGLFFCHWTSILRVAAHSAPLLSLFPQLSDNYLLHWLALALLGQLPLG